jgi:hypothetical protein
MDERQDWSHKSTNTDEDYKNTSDTAPGRTRVTTDEDGDDDEDAATTLQWKNIQGRMTMMWMMEAIMMPSATGTLDRKTSQASPAACLYKQEQTTLLLDD